MLRANLKEKEIPKNEHGRGRTPHPCSFFGETINEAVSGYDFFMVSLAHLIPEPTMYVAIEGVIGVGKTTLARLLRPAFESEILL